MYKVLLVDDEILVREAISEKIDWNGLGYELVRDCENGREAMEYLESNPVDLVLTDIYMPYSDGLELSRYVHEQLPQTKVVIFSGYSEFEYAKLAIKYGVAEYLLKPVTARELSEMLAGLHKKMDLQREEDKKISAWSRAYRNYTKNESVIIAKSLSSLVKGTKGVTESLRELEDLDIRIRGSHYRVAAIDIDLYSDLYEITESQKKEGALMAFVVENISNEIIREEKAGVAYRDADNRVCLLMYTNKPHEFKGKAFALCQKIKSSVYDAIKLGISVGIGRYVESLEDLYLSYESAADGLKYRYTRGTGVIFDCEQQEKELTAYVDLGRYLTELAASVKGTDRQRAERTLRKVEGEIEACYISKNKAVAYLHQILYLVCDSVNELDMKLELKDAVITSVTSAKNFKEAAGIVREYTDQALVYLEGAGKSTGERQAALALDYLRENYSNPNLSLNEICSYLCISTSHFSNIFKEANGGTFTEALTTIRMEKAKKLLRETTLKNYEIAEKVGFSDPHYFSIAFKKMTGMTPKEFAKENR